MTTSDSQRGKRLPGVRRGAIHQCPELVLDFGPWVTLQASFGEPSSLFGLPGPKSEAGGGAVGERPPSEVEPLGRVRLQTGRLLKPAGRLLRALFGSFGQSEGRLVAEPGFDRQTGIDLFDEGGREHVGGGGSRAVGHRGSSEGEADRAGAGRKPCNICASECVTAPGPHLTDSPVGYPAGVQVQPSRGGEHTFLLKQRWRGATGEPQGVSWEVKKWAAALFLAASVLSGCVEMTVVQPAQPRVIERPRPVRKNLPQWAGGALPFEGSPTFPGAPRDGEDFQKRVGDSSSLGQLVEAGRTQYVLAFRGDLLPDIVRHPEADHVPAAATLADFARPRHALPSPRRQSGRPVERPIWVLDRGGNLERVFPGRNAVGNLAANLFEGYSPLGPELRSLTVPAQGAFCCGKKQTVRIARTAYGQKARFRALLLQPGDEVLYEESRKVAHKVIGPALSRVLHGSSSEVGRRSGQQQRSHHDGSPYGRADGGVEVDAPTGVLELPPERLGGREVASVFLKSHGSELQVDVLPNHVREVQIGPPVVVPVLLAQIPERRNRFEALGFQGCEAAIAGIIAKLLEDHSQQADGSVPLSRFVSVFKVAHDARNSTTTPALLRGGERLTSVALSVGRNAEFPKLFQIAAERQANAVQFVGRERGIDDSVAGSIPHDRHETIAFAGEHPQVESFGQDGPLDGRHPARQFDVRNPGDHASDSTAVPRLGLAVWLLQDGTGDQGTSYDLLTFPSPRRPGRYWRAFLLLGARSGGVSLGTDLWSESTRAGQITLILGGAAITESLEAGEWTPALVVGLRVSGEGEE